jgi:hypothetical protein
MVAAIVCLAGCVSPQLNVSAPPGGSEPIRTVALAPNGGALADAIGLELLNFGFEVFDTAQVSSLMVRMNLTEIEILEPQNLLLLKGQGIDCMLQVRAVAGYDDRPQSATVKLVSAATGKLMAGATWQNGRGGQQGSAADQDARIDLAAAARQIAEGIAKAVPRI